MLHAPTFTTTIHPRRDAVVLAHGELDLASSPTLRTAVLHRVEKGMRAIEVDMSAVSFIDCSGINAMVDIRDDVSRSGSTLAVTHPSARVLRLLRLTHTYALLTA